MDSPFKDHKHEGATPAQRMLLWLFLLAIVGAVAAVALGYVDVRFGKQVNEGAGPLPGRKVDPGENNDTSAFIRRDEEAEKVLAMFMDDARVVRSRGARIEFRLEGEVDGKKQVLAATAAQPAENKGPTDDVEGMVAWVQKDNSLDVRMSMGGVISEMKDIAWPGLKPADKMNSITRGTEWRGVPGDLKALVGKDVEIYKTQEIEHFQKGDAKAGKQEVRRTLRLIARVVAVNQKDEK